MGSSTARSQRAGAAQLEIARTHAPAPFGLRANGNDAEAPVGALQLCGVQDYTRLLVWQRARQLTISIHDASRRFPDRSVPGLRSQLLRATMSIGANLAEGATRETRAEFARFVSIAIGSASETQHHLTVCLDLGVMDSAQVERLHAQVTEIRKMLFGLRRALIMRAPNED